MQFAPLKCEMDLVTSNKWKKWDVASDISFQKNVTSVWFTLPLLPSPLPAWWSLLPYCELVDREAHVVRNGVRPVANSSGGIEALSPTAQQPRGNWLLPTMSGVDVETDPSPLQPSDDCSPGQYWDYSLWEAEEPGKLHLDSWPTEAVR